MLQPMKRNTFVLLLLGGLLSTGCAPPPQYVRGHQAKLWMEEAIAARGSSRDAIEEESRERCRKDGKQALDANDDDLQNNPAGVDPVEAWAQARQSCAAWRAHHKALHRPAAVDGGARGDGGVR